MRAVLAELPARMLDEFARNLELLAEIVAERVGRRADELAVRTLAGAVIGVGIATWSTAAEQTLTDAGQHRRGRGRDWW
ncbi:MAG TPA: hypothetical protein VFA46_03960 [Actinomycetes bacterium]|jgi:hypothetical protein|nr:hypothetical protein [Actinomycetes bacterium]